MHNKILQVLVLITSLLGARSPCLSMDDSETNRMNGSRILVNQEQRSSIPFLPGLTYQEQRSPNSFITNSAQQEQESLSNPFLTNTAQQEKGLSNIILTTQQTAYNPWNQPQNSYPLASVTHHTDEIQQLTNQMQQLTLELKNIETERMLVHLEIQQLTTGMQNLALELKNIEEEVVTLHLENAILQKATGQELVKASSILRKLNEERKTLNIFATQSAPSINTALNPVNVFATQSMNTALKPMDEAKYLSWLEERSTTVRTVPSINTVPSMNTALKTTNDGNYPFWPGLTYQAQRSLNPSTTNSAYKPQPVKVQPVKVQPVKVQPVKAYSQENHDVSLKATDDKSPSVRTYVEAGEHEKKFKAEVEAGCRDRICVLEETTTQKIVKIGTKEVLDGRSTRFVPTSVNLETGRVYYGETTTSHYKTQDVMGKDPNYKPTFKCVNCRHTYYGSDIPKVHARMDFKFSTEEDCDRLTISDWNHRSKTVDGTSFLPPCYNHKAKSTWWVITPQERLQKLSMYWNCWINVLNNAWTNAISQDVKGGCNPTGRRREVVFYTATVEETKPKTKVEESTCLVQ